MTLLVVLAVWIRLGIFTTPEPAPSSYQAVKVAAEFPGGKPVSLYRARGAGAFAYLTAPKAPGQRDTAFALLTEDRGLVNAGGWAYRLRPRYADGDSGAWSNWSIAAVSDTLVCDLGSAWLGAGGVQWPAPNALRPDIRVAQFWRAPGDTVLFALNECLPAIGPLARFTVVNAGARARCCVDALGRFVTVCR